jgi:hypothetical protein
LILLGGGVMCCDICPYFDECQELGKLQETCCAECPDYNECAGEGFETDESDEDRVLDEF